eukprot:s140_g62.t1
MKTFEWTPAEKPVRSSKMVSGNKGRKVWEEAKECKLCKEVKKVPFTEIWPPPFHGLVFHGRKHLKIKRAGTQSDFNKEQLEAIAEESRCLRKQHEEDDALAVKEKEADGSKAKKRQRKK